MIKVYATTEDGQGYVQPLGEYEEIDDIRIYSAALGPNVLITFFNDWTEEEKAADEKEQMTTDDEDDVLPLTTTQHFPSVSETLDGTFASNNSTGKKAVDCTGEVW
jgi:hypothetical protein